ncbi:uncharacterized protein C9orf153 homolog [Marmota marmota marmota]|uniref:uncharacterized protein C9orf153 homolog n=1 Tax=Marmota marmota marmota TaxID=9994 RepID=UPI0020933D99|nr:uncharacterized protein C9orf153 homolog [Marmota marmota marmota]
MAVGLGSISSLHFHLSYDSLYTPFFLLFTPQLPELYASVENFRKNRKNSILLKTHGISPKEAQKILSKNLNERSFISKTSVKEDPQSIFMYTVGKKEVEKKESIVELLHRSLLMDPLPPKPPPSKSQKRLAQIGIPPPIHTFPYNIMDDHSSAFPKSTIIKKIQSIKILGFPDSIQEKMIYEDKVPRYVSANPGNPNRNGNEMHKRELKIPGSTGIVAYTYYSSDSGGLDWRTTKKQFMDLRDLEWKYVKGLAKWKCTTPVSFVDIKYNTEKRFVESQTMPGFISPPLVRKSFVIYPQTSFLNWNI